MQPLSELVETAESDIQAAADLAALDKVRVRYLGKKGLLTARLKDLSKIADIRQAKKVKHQLTVVLLYGLLSFVFQMTSRRQANQELSRPAFLATLQQLFPELETLPQSAAASRRSFVFWLKAVREILCVSSNGMPALQLPETVRQVPLNVDS